MKNKKVIALLCADIHLSHRPPMWRSAEPDWYAAMKRPLDEIELISQQYKCPVLVAGDLFERWNSTPELINWAIKNMPRTQTILSIPGQHDLPEHNLDNIHRSAYETLVRANKINDILVSSLLTEFIIFAFPFGKEIEPIKDGTPSIALIHEYVWTGRHKYPHISAPANRVETRSSKMIDGKLYGYDVIVYGDNHKGFHTKVGNTTVFNCGSLMRRHSDEKDYQPQVGLLYSDGSVEPHYLDTSADRYLEISDVERPEELDMETLYQELKKLTSKDYNYPQAVVNYCRAKKISKDIVDVLAQAMDDEK